MTNDSIKEMREYINLTNKYFGNKNVFILTEGNVLDVYKKLVNKQEVPADELKAVQKRFFELLNY